MPLQPPFTTPNFEIGSYIPNGLRTGPESQRGYTQTPVPVPVPTPNIIGRSMSYGLGPGMINGPVAWYRCNPANPANGVINNGTAVTTVNTSIPLQTNIVAERATQYFVTSDGTPALQLDVPRTVSYTATIAQTTTAQTTLQITTRGIDIWGQNLTSIVSLTVALGTGQTVTVETPSAFWQIIGNPVVTDLTFGAGATTVTITSAVGAQLGLPYYLKDQGCILNYAQYSILNNSQGTSEVCSPIYPISITTTPSAAITFNQISAPSLITNGLGLDQTPTATTEDVRGMMSPNLTVTRNNGGDLVAGDDFGWNGSIYICYNVVGADFLAYQQNQVLSQIQQSLTNSGALSSTDWAGFGKPLDTENLSDIPTLNQLIGLIPYSDIVNSSTSTSGWGPIP